MKILNNNMVEIYPNPTNGKLKINCEITYQEIKISVFTMEGQKMLEIKDKTELDISHLTSGAYIFIINIDKNIEVEKIIKIE